MAPKRANTEDKSKKTKCIKVEKTEETITTKKEVSLFYI